MDFLDLLTSVNKVSVFFFIITLGVLGYEFYLFNKEKEKSAKPKIPDFKETGGRPLTYTTIVAEETPQQMTKKRNMLPIVITIVFLIFFGIIGAIGIFNFGKEEPVLPPRTTTVPTAIPLPTQVLLAEEEITPTATAEPTLTPTPQITEILIASSSPTIATTNTPTPASSTSSAQTTSIPQAGSVQYPFLIFLIATLTVFVSFLF